MMTRLLPRRESGMTLIETLVAIFIFSIVTIGIVPLLASSLRGSELVRTSTVAKNLAVESMERARGLPYYISRARNANDVDLLDLYYPDQPNSGISYLTTCDSGDASAACPNGQIPAGFTIEYLATFQNANGAPVTPISSYDSSPDATGETDDPPAALLNLRITARWESFAQPRQFGLESLLGDRAFGSDQLRGSAILDYVVSVSTTYETDPASTLIALAGTGESSIQSRTGVVAAERVVAGSISVSEGGADPVRTEGTRALLEAEAQPAVTAPPEGTPEDPLAVVVGGYTAADMEGATFFGPPGDTTTAVSVGSSPEYARGGFLFPSTTTLGNVWVDKNVSRGNASTLRLLDPSIAKLVSVGPSTASAGPLRGYSSVRAEATTIGGLTTAAGGSFARLRLLPTSFATGGVIVVQNFDARVSCNSTSVGIPAAPVAEFSGTLVVSVDASEGASGGQTTISIPLSSTSLTDPLAAYSATDPSAPARNAQNPIVFEDPTNAGQVGTGAERSAPGDVYLFPQSHVHRDGTVHEHAGYIESWQSRVGVDTAAGGSDDASSASIDEVIGIATAPLPTATGTTDPISVSVGSMSCEALDQR